MTTQRYNLNDLTRDIAHLATLIDVITVTAVDMIDGEKKTADEYAGDIGRMTNLLWIARDMVNTIDRHSDGVHSLIHEEKVAVRKAVAS